VNTGDQTIGERLAQIRKKRGYTQKELAQKMGLIQSLISAYECNNLRLTSEMLIRFCNTLKISADEILGTKKIDRKEPVLSLRLVRRLKKIESLPPSKQKAILQTVDGFLKGQGD
jgi:transcriptional regulator with XRE-family HTH domain